MCVFVQRYKITMLPPKNARIKMRDFEGLSQNNYHLVSICK